MKCRASFQQILKLVIIKNYNINVKQIKTTTINCTTKMSMRWNCRCLVCREERKKVCHISCYLRYGKRSRSIFHWGCKPEFVINGRRTKDAWSGWYQRLDYVDTVVLYFTFLSDRWHHHCNTWVHAGCTQWHAGVFPFPNWCCRYNGNSSRWTWSA